MPSGRRDRLHVMLVSQTLDRGGLEEAVLTTAQGLDKGRFEVSVAYVVGGDAARRLACLPGIRCIALSSRSRFVRLFLLCRALRRLRVDLVHNHFCWYGLLAGTIAGTWRVETVHNVYAWFTPLQRIAYSLHCLLAHRLIAVSGAVQAYARGRFATTRGKRWEVIYNGVDCQRFARREASALRASFGFSPAHTVAGFSGRLEEEKGVRLLLEVAELLQSLPEIRFLIAGSGSLEVELKERAAANGLTNVVFAGFRHDLPDLYSVFDLLVMPSMYEGLPLALLEAMAAGCPVVASLTGGIPEAVSDGVEGFLVEPGSAQVFARHIAALAGDPGLRATMGRAAEARAGRQFGREAMITGMENLYVRLAGKKVL